MADDKHEKISIVSQRLKLIRVTKNISQQSFADMFNYHRTNISKYECGESNPTLELVQKVAKKFRVSANWLLGLTDSEHIIYIKQKEENKNGSTEVDNQM